MVRTWIRWTLIGVVGVGVRAAAAVGWGVVRADQRLARQIE